MKRKLCSLVINLRQSVRRGLSRCPSASAKMYSGRTSALSCTARRNFSDMTAKSKFSETKAATNAWCCLAFYSPPSSGKNTNESSDRYLLGAGRNSPTDDDGSSMIRIQPISGYSDDDEYNASVGRNNRYAVELIKNYGDEGQDAVLLDLSDASDWMEYIDRTENRTNDYGGAGAYDTMRCDYFLFKNVNDDNLRSKNSEVERVKGDEETSNHLLDVTAHWRMWGKHFHFERLQRSYRSIVQDHLCSPNPTSPDESLDEAIGVAIKKSNQLLVALLQEAEHSKILNCVEHESKYDDVGIFIQLVKLTILWSAPKIGYDKDDSKSKKITVRGHACSSGKLVEVTSHCVQPIVCSIAAKYQQRRHQQCVQTSTNNGNDMKSEKGVVATVDSSLPTRILDPQNKIASWTRLRKQLASPSTYKPPGVVEVLMVHPLSEDSSELEILEGLSSNFFVVYNDGALRTAFRGVLDGYVRHLVLKAAKNCNLRVEDKPITLTDAEDGLWKEAFITSSSRLILPISEILVSHANDDDAVDESLNDGNNAIRLQHGSFVQLWEAPNANADEQAGNDGDEQTSHSKEQPKWQQLLEEILRQDESYR